MKETIAVTAGATAVRRLLTVLAVLAAVSETTAKSEAARPAIEVNRWGRRLTLDYRSPPAGDRGRVVRSSDQPPEFSVYRDGQEIASGTFRYG